MSRFEPIVQPVKYNPDLDTAVFLASRDLKDAYDISVPRDVAKAALKRPIGAGDQLARAVGDDLTLFCRVADRAFAKRGDNMKSVRLRVEDVTGEDGSAG